MSLIATIGVAAAVGVGAGALGVGLGTAAAIGIGAGSLFMGAESASNQQGISNQALGLAQTTQQEQMYWNQQLQQLMKNPSEFLSSPIFQSTLNTGLQGVSRTMAAEGYTGSGNEATALTQYGTSFASGQLLSQEQLLASMGGATNASSPTQALGAASGSQSASFNELGAILASLGYSAGGGGGGGGWNPASMAGSPNG